MSHCTTGTRATVQEKGGGGLCDANMAQADGEDSLKLKRPWGQWENERKPEDYMQKTCFHKTSTMARLKQRREGRRQGKQSG